MTAPDFQWLRPVPEHPDVDVVSLPALRAAGVLPERLPVSLQILAEHVLRHGGADAADQVRALATGTGTVDLRPHRLLLQDASGIPVLADLVTLRETVEVRGGDGATVAPSLQMDLVVDHALEVDHTGSGAAERNLRIERERHRDRYAFLDWAAGRIPGLRVVPPGTGICHQLNLEVFSKVVHVGSARDGRKLAGFDSVLGTDSHTTMVNGLSVVGWGIGGIEATAAALGQPVTLPVPEVVGVRLIGVLPTGVLATDVALRLAELLREAGVVGAIVEFAGPGLETLSVPDRATIANMAPEYGATMAFFPPGVPVLSYLTATGRAADKVQLVEAVMRAQALLGSAAAEPEFGRVIELDLCRIGRSMAGPSRPEQRLDLTHVARQARSTEGTPGEGPRDGDVVIAAITSCTNTSNPRAMVAAGLLARNAVSRGLAAQPWVKTSLTPGSRAMSRLLEETGLQQDLDALGFRIAGHGCATCMGNSGPLPAEVSAASARGVRVAAVLSGNRNFAGRIHPDVTESYLASPPLVVAAALAGSVRVDLEEAVGLDRDGRPVRLTDLWPTDAEIDELAGGDLLRSAMASGLDLVPHATEKTGAVPAHFPWQGTAGMIRRPPFADLEAAGHPGPDPRADVHGARALLLLGDAVTTDDISPVARIGRESAAGRWLREQGVNDPGTFAARRLNHDVMLRGGFANPRLVNRLVPGEPGGRTLLQPDGEIVEVHEAAQRYRERDVPVVVVAGASYGAGSARDWAAKVTRLLGVRAVLAAGFERIHRTNLVAMGVLPLELDADAIARLDGHETFDLVGLAAAVEPGGEAVVVVRRDSREIARIAARGRVDTAAEAGWMRAGGLLPALVEDRR